MTHAADILHVLTVDIGIAAHAESNHIAVQTVQSVHGVAVVGIGHHHAVLGGDQIGKAAEGVFTSARSLKKSRWSASMSRITAVVGRKDREGVAVFAALQNDGVAFAHPVAGVQQGQGAADHHGGSIWAAMTMWVHMEVVVVLPWVPEMHRACL